jgi:hypothetical protein
MPAPKMPGNLLDTLPPYDDEAGWSHGRESVLEPLPQGIPTPPLVAALLGE